MNMKKPNWYAVFYAVALITVSFLYFRYHIDKKFIGIVETKSHLIGAQEPGTIRNILVKVGDQVKKGQVLATLDISDLESQIKQLKNELSTIRDLRGAHEDRYFLEYQRLATNLADRLSLLEAKRAELNGLNAEIDRLQKAEEAGLGHSRDLADLILQRDVLNSYLQIQSNELQVKTQQLDTARKNRYIIKRTENDKIVKSMLSDIMERTEDLQRTLSLTEHRINLRTIVSPCDGFVVELFSYPGDVVEEFIPVLSLEESEPEFVTVYLPEKTNISLQNGMQVRVYSARSKKTTIGEIVFIHPGLTQTNERLSFRGQLFWARKVLVKLKETHDLLGGEVVYARINHFSNHKKHTQTTVMSKNYNFGQVKIKEMQIPPSLIKQTRFEPSGITWLQELEKFLIVSDDTGIRHTKNDHVPFMFLMNIDGQIAPDLVILKGVQKVNDLEAITSAGNDLFYLVSSQNISKRGKRPKNRESILKVRNGEKGFEVTGEVSLLSLLLNSYSTDTLSKLGLTQHAVDGLPLLNIEGAAWHQGALYFGLKQPVTKTGAIIWKLDQPDTIFEENKLKPDQLTVYGNIQLGQFENRVAGFSDIIFDRKGNLWALSTFADVNKDKQTGGLHRISLSANGRFKAETLTRFPGLKPEGLTFINDDQLLIVFDNDNQTPTYCVFNVEL